MYLRRNRPTIGRKLLPVRSRMERFCGRRVPLLSWAVGYIIINILLVATRVHEAQKKNRKPDGCVFFWRYESSRVNNNIRNFGESERQKSKDKYRVIMLCTHKRHDLRLRSVDAGRYIIYYISRV